MADGLAGFGAVLQALPAGSARVNTVRTLVDGEFVVAHTDYNFFGPKIGFDVFRFEQGRVVEHWDNLQETPASPNPSGHSMIDGPTQPIDQDRTAENNPWWHGSSTTSSSTGDSIGCRTTTMATPTFSTTRRSAMASSGVFPRPNGAAPLSPIHRAASTRS